MARLLPMTANTSATSAHEWAVGSLVHLTRDQEQDLLVADIRGEAPRIALLPGAEVDPIILSCLQCMRPYDTAANEPCIPVPMP